MSSSPSTRRMAASKIRCMIPGSRNFSRIHFLASAAPLRFRPAPGLRPPTATSTPRGNHRHLRQNPAQPIAGTALPSASGRTARLTFLFFDSISDAVILRTVSTGRSTTDCWTTVTRCGVGGW